MSRVADYLHDLLDEIRLLETFTVEGEQAFYADERTQYAVMMAYARIGEIAKRLPDSLLATRPEAEWRDVKGFRDILLHRYDEIVPRRVWDAVKKLPTLKAAVEAILHALPPDDE
jgi:uncharacterized protein with HEPN domain